MKEPRQKCLWILDGKLILRCQLQKNILKVFVFLTETKEPIELYAKKVSEVIGYGKRRAKISPHQSCQPSLNHFTNVK